VFETPARLTLELPGGVPSDDESVPVLAARLPQLDDEPLYQVWPTVDEEDGSLTAEIDHFSVHGLQECSWRYDGGRSNRYACLDVEMGSDGRTVEIDRSQKKLRVEKARVDLPMTKQEAKQLPFPFAPPPPAAFRQMPGPDERYWSDPHYGRAAVLWYRASGSVLVRSIVYFPPEDAPPERGCDVLVEAWGEAAVAYGPRSSQLDLPNHTVVQLSASPQCLAGLSAPHVSWRFQPAIGEGPGSAPIVVGSGQGLDWKVARGTLEMVVSRSLGRSGGSEVVSTVTIGVSADNAPTVTYISPLDAQPLDSPIPLDLHDVTDGPVLDGPFADQLGEVQWEQWSVDEKTGAFTFLEGATEADDAWTFSPLDGTGLGPGIYEARTRIFSPDVGEVMSTSVPRRLEVFDPSLP